MKPVLLSYHMTGDRGSKIFFTAMRLGIHLRPVEKSEYSQTLNALCGLEPMHAHVYDGEDFPDEMFVMANFPDQLITQFLDGLRRMNAPRIALRAILTESNGSWDSLALHHELSEERAAILAANKSVHGSRQAKNAL